MRWKQRGRTSKHFDAVCGPGNGIFLVASSCAPRVRRDRKVLSQVLPSVGPAIVCTILQLVARTIRRFKTIWVRHSLQAVGLSYPFLLPLPSPPLLGERKRGREKERGRRKLVMVGGQVVRLAWSSNHLENGSKIQQHPRSTTSTTTTMIVPCSIKHSTVHSTVHT